MPWLVRVGVRLISGMAMTLLVPSANRSMSCILSSTSPLLAVLTYSPRVAQDAPTEILQTHVLSSKFGKFTDINGKPVNGFVSFCRQRITELIPKGFNGIHYKNQIYNPLFAIIQAGEAVNPKLVASATFDGIGGGDIIVRPQLAHPI